MRNRRTQAQVLKRNLVSPTANLRVAKRDRSLRIKLRLLLVRAYPTKLQPLRDYKALNKDLSLAKGSLELAEGSTGRLGIMRTGQPRVQGHIPPKEPHHSQASRTTN